MDTLKKIVIFVLDDEPEILELFHLVFEPPKYEVKVLNGPDDFAHAFKKQKPDALISDLVLRTEETGETIDGIDLIEMALSLYPDLDVFVMSGFLTKDRLSRLKDLSIRDTSAKPFNMMAYSERIKEHLNNRLN